MDWHDKGIILQTRKLGEHDCIVEALTAEHGRHSGVVKGGCGRRFRGVLQPGNEVDLNWRGRIETHLGTYQVEAHHNRSAAIFHEPGKLAALTSALALVTLTLPEREPHPNLFKATQSLLSGLEAGEDHTGFWCSLLVHWELGLLRELGFGLDLSCCAATGTNEELVYVSPKSGRAVSRMAGRPYHDKLLPLPSFLRQPGPDLPGEKELRDAMTLTTFFLERFLLSPQARKLPPARLRVLYYI